MYGSAFWRSTIATYHKRMGFDRQTGIQELGQKLEKRHKALKLVWAIISI